LQPFTELPAVNECFNPEHLDPFTCDSGNGEPDTALKIRRELVRGETSEVGKEKEACGILSLPICFVPTMKPPLGYIFNIRARLLVAPITPW
jgi:hypothetical protein